MIRYGRFAFFGLAVLFVLAIVWQALLAGLGLFRSGEVWGLHMDTGHSVVVIPLLMLVLSLALRLGRKTDWYAGLLLLGTVLQAEVFAVVRESLPVVAAFHPVFAMLLFAGGGLVVRHAWVMARQPVAVRTRETAACLPSASEEAC